MYKLVSSIDNDLHQRLKDLAASVKWKVVLGSGRDYLTAYVDDVAALFNWEHHHSYFFLKIPPGGKVHPHTDADDPWATYHIVVETNPGAISYVEGKPFDLRERGVYEIDRQLEHWSVNEGDEDRIHLIAEIYE